MHQVLYTIYKVMILAFRRNIFTLQVWVFLNLKLHSLPKVLKYFSTVTRTGWLTILFDKKSCVFEDGTIFHFELVLGFFSHTIPFWASCACKLPYLLPKDLGPIVCVLSPFLEGYLTYPHKLSLWLSTLFCLLVICFSISLV